MGDKQTIQMIRRIVKVVEAGKLRMIKKIVSRLKKMTPSQVQKWNEII